MLEGTSAGYLGTTTFLLRSHLFRASSSQDLGLSKAKEPTNSGQLFHCCTTLRMRKKILVTKSFYHCDLCLLPLVLCSSQKNLAPRLYMGSFLLLPISPPNTLTFSILRQTNPSPKELSQDDQVHPCYHPPS